MNFENFGFVDGLAVVAIGLVMVFVILGVICLVLSIFSFVSKLSEKKNASQVIEEKPDIVETKTEIQETEETKDDLELVAVITAAVAASMNTTSDKIVVRSLRKVSNWNEAAIRESQRSIY